MEMDKDKVEMEPINQKLTAESILRYVQSHGVNYVEAVFTLDAALRLLRQITQEELLFLPMAEGIKDNFNFDDFLPSAKRLLHKDKQYP